MSALVKADDAPFLVDVDEERERCTHMRTRADAYASRRPRVSLPFAERGPMAIWLCWIVAFIEFMVFGTGKVPMLLTMAGMAATALMVRRYRPEWLGIWPWQR